MDALGRVFQPAFFLLGENWRLTRKRGMTKTCLLCGAVGANSLVPLAGIRTAVYLELSRIEYPEGRK